ncbi:hypothetical protein IRZ71_20120 [Flavobacterium sp. ANB]|uniref:hypothetical protein n=1 Tax=unclassified Flavobacterium TaxID=196869 RepID=UPI0012B9E0A3|nr:MULTISPECIES: hypothetical protein [unclassified Flavobacterium]MBF4518668.1 hypothetical protein [Flavobacterium sp. ANB]MTD67826.1 hypothetical protein [Flavobacterium sp. LC2016-13]
MITIVNNVKKLKENPKSFIDANAIINEQIQLIIKDLTQKIKRINSPHDAKVVISGDSKGFSLNIDSEDEETIKLIQNVLDQLK